MNENKISFIICCNDDFYIEECYCYLDELAIPEGYEADIIEIRDAVSMTAGYNEAMGMTDAKYKVYLHQDVFLKNKNFISDLLTIFQSDKNIGMVGMVGTPYLDETGVMWKGIRFGNFYRLQECIDKKWIENFYPVWEGILEVEAVDGLLLATQYDIPWREDLFQRWDFYDISQSFEFRKAGYMVVVAGHNPEWYIHDCGVPNMIYYNEEREKFLKEYSEYMKGRQGLTWEEYKAEVVKRIESGFTGAEEEKERIIDSVVRCSIV